MSEEQFIWLENQAAKKNVTISDVVCELIDKKRLGFWSWFKLWLKRI